MKRAFCTGLTLGGLSFAGVYLHIYLQLLATRHNLALAVLFGMLLATVTGGVYMWFGRGCYGVTLLFWLAFALLCGRFFPISPNDMSLSMGAYPLGGGGGFALMMELLVFFLVYLLALAFVCSLLGLLLPSCSKNKLS